MLLSIPAWFDWPRGGDETARYSCPPFNPSLVRLAHHGSASPTTACCSFQSQLGSIGAPMTPVTPRSSACLSIPAWFDWRSRPKARDSMGMLLSIPAWFDWRSAAAWLGSGIAVLSIPAWFDWRPLAWGAHGQLPPLFQSQLGSIGAMTAPPPGLGPSHFQSQLGSIGAASCGGPFTSEATFQSQLGSIGARFSERLRAADMLPFNPSLVRLAPSYTCTAPCYRAPFNPSLVRLALPSSGTRCRTWTGFQSQLGSIGASSQPFAPPGRPSFQSQLGSIGARVEVVVRRLS